MRKNFLPKIFNLDLCARIVHNSTAGIIEFKIEKFMTAKKIIVYTDGSCKGNPGPGGWCALIFKENQAKPDIVLRGGEAKTTNNRMEMLAVIEALRYMHENHLQSSFITLYSDSNLVIKTLTEGWKRKANLDLWEELDQLNEELEVDYQWVRGHNKNRWNEECDKIACAEAEKISRKKISAEMTERISSRGGKTRQQHLFEI